MTIAAKDMEDRIVQLIALTRRLSELLFAETVALKARDPNACATDWPEKEKLAHTYRLEMSDLKLQKDALQAVSPDLRKVLQEVTGRFQDILAEHAKAISVMQHISEGLVESIAREIANHSNTKGYGAAGQQTDGGSSGLAVNAKA